VNSPEVISALIGVVGTGLIGGFIALITMYVKINIIQAQVEANTEYKNQSEPDKNKALAAVLKNNALLEQVLLEQRDMKKELHALKIELENVLALNPNLKKPIRK
jgi:3-hydroxyacyl-CoA dehydrogenase